MIVLSDTVTINVSPAILWNWLETLPDHIEQWHPDHIDARWINGNAFTPGAVMAVTERLHGKLHHLRMTAMEVEPGYMLRYRIFPGLAGRFLLEGDASVTQFTATIEVGWNIPVLGRLIDHLLHWLIPGRLHAIRQHQAEEGVRLKTLLEQSGRQSGAG